MKCEVASDLLVLLPGDELGPIQKWRVRRHLDGCPDCKHRLEDLQGTGERLRALGTTGYDRLEDHLFLARRGRLYEGLKRAADIVAGVVLLILGALPFLYYVWRIRREVSGPVLCTFRRAGQDGRPFLMCRFRTTVRVPDPDEDESTLFDSPDLEVGRKLRQNKWQRLPELLNVLHGEMSLVGPKAHSPRLLQTVDPQFRTLLGTVRPGITGESQLRHRLERRVLEAQEDRRRYYLDVFLPAKVEIESRYVRRRSLHYDAWVFLRTISAIVRGIVVDNLDKQVARLQGWAARRCPTAAAGRRAACWRSLERHANSCHRTLEMADLDGLPASEVRRRYIAYSS